MSPQKSSYSTHTNKKTICPDFSSIPDRKDIYLELGLSWPPKRNLHLHEGASLASHRLLSSNFTPSPTQKITPSQGDSCMFHALQDQLIYQPGLSQVARSHLQLRHKLVQAAFNSVQAGKLQWVDNESLEEWRDTMSKDGRMGDQVILQTASNMFKRDIVILPVFLDTAHIKDLGITLISPSNSSTFDSDPLYLQYFSESRFLTPHYQSIRPINDLNFITEYVKQIRMEDQIVSLIDSLPNPPKSKFETSTFSSSLFSSSMSNPPSLSSSVLPSVSMSSLYSSFPQTSFSSIPSSKLPRCYVIGSEITGIGRQTRV